MGKLFGTDGIRGVAGEPPLEARTIYAVGRAVGEWLREQKSLTTEAQRSRRVERGGGESRSLDSPSGLARDDKNVVVLLAEDTRESSPWVTSYLTGGLRAAGVEAVSAGVLPTPGVARLVRARGFAAGVVVSASHNPYRDNGIKLIGATGMKLPDETEERIEERIRAMLERGKTKEEEGAKEATEGEEFTAETPFDFAQGEQRAQRKDREEQKTPVKEPEAVAPRVELALQDEYVELLREAMQAELPAGLGGAHVVVDCANGAATRVAPKLLGELGARVRAIHAAPDGRNINEGCGALHPEVMARKVAEIGADLGVAFDGDADRAMFGSATGRVINGDGVLLLMARWMQQKGTLKGGVVVGTSMANLGLEVALKREGLPLVRTAVGDRYVLEEMLRRGANLGGEQSGHIIFLDDSPAGDGLLTALKVLTVVRATGKGLEELTRDLKVFPQVIRNVRVREKVPLETLPAVQKAIEEAEAALAPASAGQGARGRVVVRYSGTEPLLRVMVEAETEELVQRWARRIASAIEAELGV